MKRYRFGGGGGGGEEGEIMDVGVANVLMFQSGGGGGGGAGQESDSYLVQLSSPSSSSAAAAAERVFECKTCNRRFPSFQALGGHRASHKKSRLAGDGHGPAPAAKPRAHECSVCGLEFAIGQALGGHMRRHRAAAAEAGLGNGLAAAAASNPGDDLRVRGALLDLNLPPMDQNDLKLGLGLEICG